MELWAFIGVLVVCLGMVEEGAGDIPVCTPDNMMGHPFCFPVDYNKDLIPPVENSLQVHVETFIFEVSKIDDISLTITFELYMDLMWEESRIIVNESSPDWGPSGTFMGSTNFIDSMWLPDIQIFKCKQFKKRKIVTDVAGLIIFKNRKVLYTISTEVIVACPMKFSAYPLDYQTCKFLVGSYIHDASQIYFTGMYKHDYENQRAQQYVINCKELDWNDTILYHANRTFSQTGFQVDLVRRRTPVLLQVYLTTGLFVLVSWISFIVPPEVVPGRMSLLVTLFLVLVNIFNSVTANAPKAEGLTAVEMWVVSCIIHVFAVLAEYAVILKLIQNIKHKESAERRREERLVRQSQSQQMAAILNIHNHSVNNAGRQCLVQGDGETALLNNGRKETQASQSSHEPAAHNPHAPHPALRVAKQLKKDMKAENHKRVQECVDRVAMYLFPCIFIIFNLCYWPYYLIFIDWLQ